MILNAGKANKMKVKELIKELEKFDEDMEVFHEYNGPFSSTIGRVKSAAVEEVDWQQYDIQELVIIS